MKDLTILGATRRSCTCGPCRCADLEMRAEILHFYLSIYSPYDSNASGVQQEDIRGKDGGNVRLETFS